MGLFKEYNLSGIHERSFSAFVNEGDEGILVDNHWHDYYEILYLYEGEARQRVDDIEMTLTPGDILIMEPGAVHSTVSLTEKCAIAVILSMPETIRDCAGHLKGGYQKPPYACEAEIREVFNRFRQENREKLPGYETLLQGCVYEFIGYLRRGGSPLSTGNTAEMNQIKLAFSYIEDNIGGPLRLRDVSSSVGYTPEYFSKLFKEVTGYSFKSYVDYARMTRAKRLLLYENRSVSDTAGLVGYEDVSSFCRAFKRVNGCQPSSLAARFRAD